MKLFTTCSVVLTLAFGIVADANAGPILWASTGDTNDNGGGRIYTIDVDSGIVTLVGNSTLPKLAALDFDNDGILYGVTGGSGRRSDPIFLLNLYTFNTSNASPTLIGKVALAEPALPGNMNFNLQGIDGIAFDSSGALFAGGYSGVLDMGRMLILDLTDASAILTAPTVADSFTSGEAGLAFDAAGQLFGTRGGSTGRIEDLVRIDTMTEARISIGSATNVISDIWFAADGTLYGVSPKGDLFTIDSITGDKTFLFNVKDPISGASLRLSGLTGQDVAEEVPELSIDIKPWRFPNKIFPWYGLVSVAIHGSATFDPDDPIFGLDTTTLGFGPAGGAAYRWVLRGFDVNHDGYNDLIVFFRASRSGIKCGDEQAEVTGSTNSGIALSGTDTIRTVGCRKTKRHKRYWWH